MSVPPRYAATALVAAFVLGIGGAVVLSGGGESASGSSIPFNPDKKDTSTPTPTPKAKAAFTATATKNGKKIVITGEGAEPGANLIVQRRNGSDWSDFPAHAKASSDGSYSTYIITSRDGTYRVKDTGSDAASEPVDIKI